MRMPVRLVAFGMASAMVIASSGLGVAAPRHSASGQSASGHPALGRAHVAGRAGHGGQHYARRGYRGGDRTGAAVAGAALGLMGAAIAGAAASNYYDDGYYGRDPGYGYYGGPRYGYGGY